MNILRGIIGIFPKTKIYSHPGRLLQAAERRKRENERRIERQVQREREAEGEEFKDKESFVTSAYKKKLEELKELEEQEKREEYLESIGDVRKQGNLDGFYRHLYSQKVNKTDRDDPETVEVKKKSEIETENSTRIEETVSRIKKRGRQYRKREDSKSNDEEVAEKELSHLPSNLDADSDFSIDSDSDSNSESQPKKVKEEVEEIEDRVVVEVKKVEVKEVKVEVKGDEVREVEKPKKVKIDIWKKRTVGVVFDEALQRYHERKALRESG